MYDSKEIVGCHFFFSNLLLPKKLALSVLFLLHRSVTCELIVLLHICNWSPTNRHQIICCETLTNV